MPQFVNQAAGHVPVQMLFLGIFCILQAIIMFSVISFLAEKLCYLLLRNSSLSRKMNFIQGSVPGLIAVPIAFSEK